MKINNEKEIRTLGLYVKKILNSSYNHPTSIPLNQNLNGIKMIHGNVHCSL